MGLAGDDHAKNQPSEKDAGSHHERIEKRMTTDHRFPPATLVMGDIDPTFIKLAKRLQQVAKMSANGLSVITLSVFLYDGVPIQWTRPDLNSLTTLETLHLDSWEKSRLNS
jgi:hypothetical protein